MKSRVIVSVLIERDGKFLFGRKSKDVGPYPNTWHLPGGGVNLGEESLLDAVKREIKEETGVEVDKIERLSFDEDYENNKHGELTHYIFLVYKATHKSGEAKASDDIAELKWFSKEELNGIQLARPSIKLFKKLGLL